MTTKTINLALQGGGAHGAYSWGVLDRLLEEKTLHIEGISGTSAGAMNAAVLVNGYIQDGRRGAQKALAHFWRKISEFNVISPLRQTPLDQMSNGWNLDHSPTYNMLDLLGRMFSPYDLNPLNLNPLRWVLEEVLDMPSLQACSVIRLFVAATHVESGQARIFECHEITTDVLLASACIPVLFQSIEIDGEHYWDGGYMGNPAIWPLIYHTRCEDVVLVQINPIHRPDLPRRAMDIVNRLNEITFNSSLIAEMRAIDFVSRLIHDNKLDPTRYKDVKMHLIYSPERMRSLNASSKMNASWEFFRHLHAIGRAAADQWLKESYDRIGVESTINIREKFLCGPPPPLEKPQVPDQTDSSASASHSKSRATK